MQIFVKLLDGNTVVLDVCPSQSVYSVQQQIESLQGVPSCHQRLLFGGQALARNRKLQQCDIGPESTLHLTLRVVGGADEFEKINPISQQVLDGEISRRSIGTVFKWLKYEDLDPDDILNWKKSIQGVNSKGQVKWDFTMPGHKRFRSLSQGLNRVPVVPDKWKAKERNPTMCNFIHEDKNQVRWICNNNRASHPVTRKLFDKCGWHTIECLGEHNDNDRPRIEHPNADGLCTAHYFAKHTEEPAVVPFLDTPGIAILNVDHFKEHMKLAKMDSSAGDASDDDMTLDTSTNYSLNGDEDDDITTIDGGRSQEELLEEEIERQLQPQDYDGNSEIDAQSVNEEFYEDEVSCVCHACL